MKIPDYCKRDGKACGYRETWQSAANGSTYCAYVVRTGEMRGCDPIICDKWIPAKRKRKRDEEEINTDDYKNIPDHAHSVERRGGGDELY